MSHALSRVFIHAVWATFQRTPWIILPSSAASSTRSALLECALLAVGAADDHIHVVSTLPRDVSIGALVRAYKGASARAAASAHRAVPFRWQEGHDAFSVSERDPSGVIDYVRRQRERHAARETAPQ